MWAVNKLSGSNIQSFLYKKCPGCSTGAFIHEDTTVSYTGLGSTIQRSQYTCSNCQLKIEYRRVKEVSNLSKREGLTLNKSPLSNISIERSINPLKIPLKVS